MNVCGEDRDRILAVVAADHGFMREFIDDFLQDVPSDIQSLEDAILTRDASQLEAVAHGLKSVVGLFCAMHAYSLAREMENLARERDFAGAAHKMVELRSAVEQLKQILISVR